MTSTCPDLGRCPDCDSEIPDHNLLIDYESSDGQLAMYAECPECEVPVHPL